MKYLSISLLILLTTCYVSCSDDLDYDSRTSGVGDIETDASVDITDSGNDVYVCLNDIVLEPIDIIDDKPFKKGPYIMYTDTTFTTIMWQTDSIEPSVVEFGETQNDMKRVVGNESDMHEVRIDGLRPDTEYFYRVGNGQNMTNVFKFRTNPARHRPFRFVAYSDSQNHPEIHSKLIPMIASRSPAFVLHAGDAVEKGGEEERWQTEFFDVVRPLIFFIPYYISIGNHEANSKYFYKYVSYPYPDGDEQHESYYWFRYGAIFVIVIDSNKYYFGTEDPQHKWVINSLKRPEAIWAGLRIAVFHEGAYTDGWGTCNYDGNLQIRSSLLPVLENGGVNLIINGHTHGYERGFLNGVYHMIVGGGGGSLDHKCNDFEFIQKTNYVHHFISADVLCDRIYIEAIDLEGNAFDSFEIPFSYPLPAK